MKQIVIIVAGLWMMTLLACSSNKTAKQAVGYSVKTNPSDAVIS